MLCCPLSTKCQDAQDHICFPIYLNKLNISTGIGLKSMERKRQIFIIFYDCDVVPNNDSNMQEKFWSSEVRAQSGLRGVANVSGHY